jgi:3-oxoacyl-[acyl-carrier-protein] synthase II
MSRRVVITGIGVLSPLGIGRDAYGRALRAGNSAFRPVTLFDASTFGVPIAGEITEFDPVLLLGKKGLRDLDRSTKMLSAAAKLAIDDSGLGIDDANAGAVGVSVGTTFGSLHSIAQFDRTGLLEGPRLVNPSHFPNTVINSPASQVSIRFHIRGFNTTVSTGGCSGLDALSYAADFVRLGRADGVLAGSVEELCEETFRWFHGLGCLSGADGSEPQSRPFDARRNGVILSEGAGMLVVETEEHAQARNARILAVIRGCGNAFDRHADETFDRAGGGLLSAVTRAMREAGTGPEDIDYVCSCANSTPGLDRMETRVLKQALGDRARHVPVSSIKSMLGETYSASGTLALAAAVEAIGGGFVPATVNYSEPDPACDLDCVPNEARSQTVRTVLVTSADPYGQNAAVVLGAYGE